MYIGVTNDLDRRVREHKDGSGSKFTQKYNVNTLVYFERFTNMEEAIKREKQLKKWKRSWKIALIEKENQDWLDLSQIDP